MIRFLKSSIAAAVIVLLVGSVVLAASGAVRPADEQALTDVSVLAQVDDGATDDTTDSEAPAVPQTSPIEQLLQQLYPATDAGGLPSSQRVVLSRDPFQPVVPEPATNDGTDGDGTDGDGTDGDGTDGDGTDGDGTDGGTSDGCSGDEGEVVCDGFVVTLDAITDDGLAVVSVNGTTYTVGVGDEFAQHFKVLAIDDPSAEVPFARLQFGDDTFSLRTGVTVLK